jgi:hypothetical protein
MLRLYDLLYQLSYRLAASIEAKDKAAVCFAFREAAKRPGTRGMPPTGFEPVLQP